MWKSEIWYGPAREFDSDRELTPEADAWTEKISREPWTTGLLKLTEPRGWWVGTEDWLLKELQDFAGDAVYRSRDFPDSLDCMMEYASIAHEPCRRLGLGILDYREHPAPPIIYRFDVPEWDWDNNVLVYQGDMALRKYYIKAEQHPDPLPKSLLLIAAESRTGAYKSWSGTTAELRSALLDQRGLAWSQVDQYLELFGTWDRMDYAAFHGRIEGCMPFLREIGVHVRKTASSRTATSEYDDGLSSEDGTWWSIEVPAWKHKRGYAD